MTRKEMFEHQVAARHAIEKAAEQMADEHYALTEQVYAGSSRSAHILIEEAGKRIKEAQGPAVITELAQLNLLLKAEMLMQGMPLAVQAAEAEGPEGRQRLRERLIGEMEDGPA